MLTPAMSASSTSSPRVRRRNASSTQVRGPPFLYWLPFSELITTGWVLLWVITVGPWPKSGRAPTAMVAAPIFTNSRRLESFMKLAPRALIGSGERAATGADRSPRPATVQGAVPGVHCSDDPWPPSGPRRDRPCGLRAGRGFPSGVGALGRPLLAAVARSPRDGRGPEGQPAPRVERTEERSLEGRDPRARQEQPDRVGRPGLRDHGGPGGQEFPGVRSPGLRPGRRPGPLAE